MALTVQTLATNTYLSVPLPLDSLPKTFTYDDDGNIETMITAYAGITYIKTFTWTDGVLTDESQWTPPS